MPAQRYYIVSSIYHRYLLGSELSSAVGHALVLLILLTGQPVLANTTLASTIQASTVQATTAQANTDQALRSRLIAAIERSDSFNDRYDAEVWLLDMSQRLSHKIKDPHRRLEMLRLIHKEAIATDVPPELVLAVIEIESDFNHWAISSSGAQGLMQVMPFWLKEIGHSSDNLFDTHTNLRLGCTILKYYLDMEQGQIRQALARYNGSYGQRRYPDKVLHALTERWYRQ